MSRQRKRTKPDSPEEDVIAVSSSIPKESLVMSHLNQSLGLLQAQNWSLPFKVEVNNKIQELLNCPAVQIDGATRNDVNTFFKFKTLIFDFYLVFFKLLHSQTILFS